LSHSASHQPAVGMSVPWKNPGRLLLIFALAELQVLDVARCPSLSASNVTRALNESDARFEARYNG
jgi:uncharacterized protein YcgI (DUF1989 family)